MMDTSKELYAGHDLEMIRKAVEIQELWKCKLGDNVLWQDVDGNYFVLTIVGDRIDSVLVIGESVPQYSWPHIKTKKGLLFLPRQDQLQDLIQQMAIDDPNITVGTCYWSNQFIELENWLNIPTKENPPSTWEQVWLNFLYIKKFNKVWNRKDWVGV